MIGKSKCFYVCATRNSRSLCVSLSDMATIVSSGRNSVISVAKIYGVQCVFITIAGFVGFGYDASTRTYINACNRNNHAVIFG